MASSRPRTLLNSRGQRTNSLGYAKHDCHTCSARNRHCDRQRPHCGPCLSDGQKCGGFTLNLVWKGVDAPTSPQVVASNLAAPESYPTKRSRGFKFVKGQMKRKRRPKESTPGLNSPSPVGDNGHQNVDIHFAPSQSCSTPQSIALDNGVSLPAVANELCYTDSGYGGGLEAQVYQASEFQHVLIIRGSGLHI